MVNYASPIFNVFSLTGSGSTGDVSGMSVTVTGTSTARTEANRAADWVNVKDYGAVLNGVTDDTAAVAAAYAATPASGLLKIPPGGWQISSFPTFTGTKLWQFTGNAFGVGSTPVFGTGDDITETILSGERAWKRIASFPSSTGTLRADFVFNIPNPNNGVYNTIQVNGTVSQSPASSGIYGLWNVNSILKISGGNNSGTNAQHVGFASTVQITGPAAGPVNWQFYGSTSDTTGFGGAGLISGEFDFTTNGTETASSNFNPSFGGRVHAHYTGSTYVPPNWPGATQSVSVGTVIQGVNGATEYTFICTTAGTTGGSQPSWPTSGTISDGSVVWTFGATVNAQYSRCIQIGSDANSSYGTGFFTKSTFYNAMIDLSYSTLSAFGGSSPAAIRLASNMPIDFSANNTLAGQNVRTLQYNSSSNALEYAVSGNVLFSVSDGGLAQAAPRSAGTAFSVSGTLGAIGFSTALATLSGPAFRMASGQTFALEATNVYRFGFNSGTSLFTFTQSGTAHLTFNLSNGNITMLSGAALQLGSTYAAGSITPTGSISIQDSTGTTYYIAVSTTP